MNDPDATSALERIAVLMSASAARIGTSGVFMCRTTVVGAGVSMLVMGDRLERATAAVAGSRIRFSDALTSVESKPAPLWNLTFLRSWKVSVCAPSENFHEVARSGTMSRLDVSWTSVP